MNNRKSLYDSIKGIAILGIMMIHIGRTNFVSQSSVINNFIFAGLLGVEITFLLNAFFYSRTYENKVKSGISSIFHVIWNMIKRIMPSTYLVIIVLSIVSFYYTGQVTTSIPMYISHFFFLNGFTSYWYNGNMGLGYVGILVLMWVLFPLFLKRVNSLEESIVYTVIVCGFSYALIYVLSKGNEYIHLDSFENFAGWLDYIKRGIVSYTLGNVLFYVHKRKDFLHKIAPYRWAVTISCLFVLIKKIADNGAQFSGFYFTIIWMMILLVNEEESVWIIDNKMFAFFGKYSFELYLTHITICRILFEYMDGVVPSVKLGVLIFVISIVISPIIHYLVSGKWIDYFSSPKGLIE